MRDGSATRSRSDCSFGILRGLASQNYTPDEKRVGCVLQEVSMHIYVSNFAVFRLLERLQCNPRAFAAASTRRGEVGFALSDRRSDVDATEGNDVVALLCD